MNTRIGDSACVRWLGTLLACCVLGCFLVVGMTERVQAQTRAFTLLVSEGTSGGQDTFMVQTRFEPLAQLISRAVGAPVQILVARDFGLLERMIAEQRADFVIARPSDYPARGIRDHGYTLVATAKPDGQCVFIGPKGAKPWSSLRELNGKALALPEERSYMARLCRAVIRQAGASPASIKFHIEQGAVGFAVENGLFPVGGVASYSSVAANWEKKGGVILWRGEPQPYLPLIARRTVTPTQIERVREALRAVSSDPNAPLLRSLNIQGFDTAQDDRLMRLLAFLEAR
ncbi:MAG: phosphate/phosphite/phosphonate ABC transporter substrate-binding protein [Casimicrobiaceae bacterium]|nr:phosphate/phosphite/phosphonate ABC transporter substrate-binding protein [Casimicrobiaceae bacterium]MCX8098848.1 phosphate/phosphite/phosphonate ABC transporter substrate-binding protein [Casimicrobiaceae bacterium]MDW8311499.1 PhnD/SsuA/transferrin family substrate-binding protein [Burkholderiales bacterium]